MCELFAVSSGVPARIRMGLAAFARHGGATAPNADGWGIALFEGAAARLIKAPTAAADSPWVRFIEDHDRASTLWISHVRRASQGDKVLANTHPFERELGGVTHVFAHNGNMEGIAEVYQASSRRFRPVGHTDSEHAFCILLNRLAHQYEAGRPELAVRLGIFAAFAAEMAALGPANFLYGDGEVLFVHADVRHDHATGRWVPPGLHLLHRDGHDLDAPGIRISGPAGLVTLVASVPLDDRPWEPLKGGEVLVLRDGSVIQRTQRPAL